MSEEMDPMSVQQEVPEGLDVEIPPIADEKSSDSPSDSSLENLEKSDYDLSDPEFTKPNFDDDEDEQPVKRKRGRPRKDDKKKIVRTTREEFFADDDDSEETSDLADPEKQMAIAGLNDGYFAVDRVSPSTIRGIPSAGMLEKYGLETPFDEIIEEIKSVYGGGTYRLRLHDSRGKWKRKKNFRIPGKPKQPEDGDSNDSRSGQDGTDELQSIKIDIKKKELEQERFKKERELERTVRRLTSEDDEFSPHSSRASKGADEDLRLELERMKIKMEYDQKLNVIREEMREMSDKPSGNNEALISAVLSSAGLVIKSIFESNAKKEESKQSSDNMVLTMMMKLAELQQSNQSAIVDATARAASSNIDLLKSLLSEKSSDKRAETQQTLDILRMGTELAMGNTEKDNEFDTGSQIVDTLLGGVRAISKKIDSARASTQQALPAPEPQVPSGRPVMRRIVEKPVETSPVVQAQATPRPVQQVQKIQQPQGQKMTAAEVAALQKTELMKRVLRSLAVEAEMCPGHSEWADGLPKYLPIDIKEQFLKCNTVDDVMIMVNPYLDQDLILDFVNILSNDTKKKWVINAVSALKKNIMQSNQDSTQEDVVEDLDEATEDESAFGGEAL